MTGWFGPALLAITLAFGAPIAIESAPAAPLHAAAELPASSNATDISSRRYNRHAHSHYANRQYSRPYYYERPYYYRPYPYYAPAPFVFGFGPWLW